MIQLRTVLSVADNSGARKLRVIQIHGGSIRRYGYVGDVVAASVIDADPKSAVKKGEKIKAVVVRTAKEYRRASGEYIRFDDNAAVLIQSRTNLEPMGSRVFGPIAREVKERGFAKIASLAPEVL